MAKEYSKLFGDLKSLYVEDVSPLDLKAQKIEEQSRQILEFKKQLDPVGEEDDDIDNDGVKNDKNDKYIRAKRAAIARAIRQRRGLKEESDFVAEIDSPYDWRSTIDEDVQAAIDELDADQITEKPVNNYAKGKTGKPVVKINPNVDLKEEIKKMGGEVLSVREGDTQFLEMVECATDYFCEEGLNADGIAILAEELGDEKFVDFVSDIYNSYMITEARAGGRRVEPVTKSGKSVAQLKGGAKTSAITRLRKEKEARKAAEDTSGKPSGMAAALRAQREIAVDKAKTKQSQRPAGQERLIRGAQDAFKSASSPESREAVKKAIGTALRSTANVGARAILAGWQGHKAAMAAKGEKKGVASQLGRGAGAAISSFMKKGTSHLKEYIEYLLDEGYDLSEITLQEMLEDLEYIEEKAVSEQQQKLFGAALSVKRGQTPRSEVSQQVLDIVDSMSEKKIRDFAKTKHEGIPQKVDEEVNYEDILTFMNY